MHALAIDLGTTTIAASLIETNSKTRLAMTGAMNPQRRFGSDVIARLNAADSSRETLREMSELIRIELLRLARELCATASIPWSDVKRIAIAGNPAMQHILLGLPVKSLLLPPFRPLFTHGKLVAAAELGWDGHADVYIFPMPGGFVGGDTVAFLHGRGVGKQFNCAPPSPACPSLYLDMGTNGEMALVYGETILATSVAAGPAFEGGNLACGMAALPGAISSVRIENWRLKLSVIADAMPSGICGSAAIETVAELLRLDIIEPGGRLKDSQEISSNLATRVIRRNGENAFVLYRDARHELYLSQGDIRQIQLAKAAVRAGMEVLFKHARIRCEALENILLTGSLGVVLQPEWLKTIGVFDKGMVQITSFTPEGALAGVEHSLIHDKDFAPVEHLGKKIRVIPLSGTPQFETMFLRHIDFPHLKSEIQNNCIKE